MDQTTLLYVMTGFVIVSAIALCVQAGMLISLSKVAKALQAQINPLVPKVEALVPQVESLMNSTKATVDATRATVDQSRQNIVDFTSHASEILNSTKRQLAMVEEVVSDATSRAKVQLEKVELVLDDTVSRAHETVATVHTGIMRPLRELNGIAAGIRMALAVLARGNRPSVAQATSDEEMFI